MGLGNIVDDDSTEQEEDSGSEEKVAYIYVRSNQNRDAYDLMSNGLGGSAAVRNALKSHPDYEDQHDFFQSLIEGMHPAIFEDNWNPLLEELEVPAEGVAQYLDSNPQLKEEVAELLRSDQQTGGSPEEAEAED